MVCSFVAMAALQAAPGLHAAPPEPAPSLAAAGVPVLSYVMNPLPGTAVLFGDAVILLDVNRDGQLDLVVGAPGGEGAGRVFVHLGPIQPGVTLTVPDMELVSPHPVRGDNFGDSFAVGDVDGDGRDELAIGAPFWRAGAGEATGAVFLFDPDDAQPWSLLASMQPQPTYRMGHSLAIGDFERAPGLEVAAGAPGYRLRPGGPQVGAVHVFSQVKSRPRERLVVNPHPSANGHDTQFGHRLAAGDWNADGRKDLAVSAIFNDVFVPALNQLWTGAGQVFIYQSPSMGIPAVVINNPDPTTDPFPVAGLLCVYQRFGNRLHFGDAVAGDGFDELTLDAHAKDSSSGVCDAGRAFIFTGRTFLQDPSPFIEQEPETPSDEELFGYRLLFADVIGDARLDWVVGAISKLEVPYIAIYDGMHLQAGGRLPPPDAVLQAPPSHGPHFNEGMVAGKLGPPPPIGEIDRDEVVLGDRDFSGFVGRVVVSYW